MISLTPGTTRRGFLGQLGALPLAAQVQAVDLLTHPVLGRVRIGAEFFLNRTETRESVFEHIRRMAETGLTLIRIFTLWDDVEPQRGQWNFERYDWIYEASAKHKLWVANTLCAEDPPGYMGTAPLYHQWQDLLNPALRGPAEVYLAKVVGHYRNHPAHGVWLLQNEPGISEKPGPYTIAAFHRWLAKTYGSVENLNRRQYRQLARFEDAVPPLEFRTLGWADYAPMLDWMRFRCDQLADQQRWLHAQVDQHHPGALTHINPPGQTSNMPASGRDLWKLKSTAHFLGSSMHAAWHFGAFSREDFGIAYGFCCDIVRSAAAPAPWWVTELQAGTTVFTGSRPLLPTSGEMTRWLWDGVGNGARGIVFWLWHPRTEGNEGGEWGIAGPNGEDTPRTRAAQAVARIIDRHAEFFSRAQPLPARSAILYNTDAMLLYSIDTRRTQANDLLGSLMGCYKALHRSNMGVDFIESRDLEKGLAARYRVLYLPYSYALTARSAEAIREFVRNGGVVWADGLVAWKDEQGTVRHLPPGPLADVFGFHVQDIDPRWEPFSLSGSADRAGELWRCVIAADRATPLIRSADGGITAVQHTYGKGRAIYYGTALTLGYFRRESSEVMRWIAAPAVEAAQDAEIRLAVPRPWVSFRALQASGSAAAVLNNWGSDTDALVCLPPKTTTVTELITGATLAVERAGAEARVRLTLAAGGSAVVLAKVVG